MKVIQTDNFARENVADQLVMGGLDEDEAKQLADLCNSFRRGENDERWFTVEPNSYRLSRGMEDLV